MTLSDSKRKKYAAKSQAAVENRRTFARTFIEANREIIESDTVWVGAMEGHYDCYIFSGTLSLSGVVDDSGTAIAMSFDGTPSGGSIGLAELTGVMTFSVTPQQGAGHCTFTGTIDAAEEGGAVVDFYQGNTNIGTFIGEAEGISAGAFSGSGTWKIN
ncbi:MAG: hypothetical protein AAFW89_11560 [Bacteroidota bacterium]